jgi:nitrate/nitrite transporter NarK
VQWDASKARNKLQEHIQAHVESIRNAKLAELKANYEVTFLDLTTSKCHGQFRTFHLYLLTFYHFAYCRRSCQTQLLGLYNQYWKLARETAGHALGDYIGVRLKMLFLHSQLPFLSLN